MILMSKKKNKSNSPVESFHKEKKFNSFLHLPCVLCHLCITIWVWICAYLKAVLWLSLCLPCMSMCICVCLCVFFMCAVCPHLTKGSVLPYIEQHRKNHGEEIGHFAKIFNRDLQGMKSLAPTGSIWPGSQTSLIINQNP